MSRPARQGSPYGADSISAGQFSYKKTLACAVSEWVNEVAQSCPTLCDPMDCSLPGSSVHGIFQARVLEWVAISFSRDPPNPGIEHGLPHCRQTLLPSEPPGKHMQRLYKRWPVRMDSQTVGMDCGWHQRVQAKDQPEKGSGPRQWGERVWEKTRQETGRGCQDRQKPNTDSQGVEAGCQW